jgi:hypothetical protein
MQRGEGQHDRTAENPECLDVSEETGAEAAYKPSALRKP